MTLADRLQSELKIAMREHDELRRDTLRMAISAAYNAEKKAHRPLTDDEFVGVLAKEIKTYRESIEAFDKAGRDDLAGIERRKEAILASFLPAALSDTELLDLIRDAIRRTGAGSARDLGRVMGVVAPQVKGRADGRMVSAMVAQELARMDLAAHDAEGGH